MSESSVVSHYEILGVPEHADAQAIEAAYRAGLAKVKASLGAGKPLPADFFHRLREAYRTLIDAERRAAYDRERKSRREWQEPTLLRMPEPDTIQVDTPRDSIMDATTVMADAPLRFQFTGTGGDYFRVWIVNLVLSVLTLGIYSAWAKVRREQFFHRNTVLAGSGFDYHGDPKAILKGRAIAWSLFALMGLSQKFNPTLYGVLVLCSIPIIPWLLMRSLKFRAANTSYRGLRFHHRGTYGGALLAFVGHGIMLIPTFGLWLPMWMRAIRRFQLDNLSFGDTRFECDPPAGGFFGAYFIAGLLALAPIALMALLLVPLLSGQSGSSFPAAAMIGFLPLALMVVLTLVVRPYIQTRLANLTWNATSVGGNKFIGSQTYASYLTLVVGNFVLVVLTLGLYWPWAKVREAAYRLERLELEASSLDDFVGRIAAERSAVGEEIADAFDLDFSL